MVRNKFLIQLLVVFTMFRLLTHTVHYTIRIVPLVPYPKFDRMYDNIFI